MTTSWRRPRAREPVERLPPIGDRVTYAGPTITKRGVTLTAGDVGTVVEHLPPDPDSNPYGAAVIDYGKIRRVFRPHLPTSIEKPLASATAAPSSPGLSRLAARLRAARERARVTEAEALGVAAFGLGIAFPLADPKMAPLLAERTEVGDSIGILKAWVRGWTKANLAAPLPELESAPSEAAEVTGTAQAHQAAAPAPPVRRRPR